MLNVAESERWNFYMCRHGKAIMSLSPLWLYSLLQMALQKKSVLLMFELLSICLSVTPFTPWWVLNCRLSSHAALVQAYTNTIAVEPSEWPQWTWQGCPCSESIRRGLKITNQVSVSEESSARTAQTSDWEGFQKDVKWNIFQPHRRDLSECNKATTFFYENHLSTCFGIKPKNVCQTGRGVVGVAVIH